MDNKISIGDKIDLVKIDTRLSVNPEKAADIYASQVLDEAPKGRIYAAMPIRGGTIVPFSVGQQFHATFYSENGLMRCEVVVTARGKRGQIFIMELEQMTALQKVQRREYYRHECRKNISYRIIEGEELEMIRSGNAYFDDDHALNWKDAIMIDMSGGGIRFVSGNKEQKKALLQIRFDIGEGETEETIYAFAELLRSERNENNASLYDSRVEFWKMDNGMRERIIHYIFEEQRKKRSQQLN